MHFHSLILPVVGLFAAGATAGPVRDGIVARQLTSPAVLRSADFDIDGAVAANAKATVNIEIFKTAKQAEEVARVTVEMVKPEIATLNAAFHSTAHAVEKDLGHAILRIGSEEAVILKRCEDKLVALAKMIAQGAQKAAEGEGKDVMDLVPGKTEGTMTALRAILTPIETFVKTSEEDRGSPGARKLAEADVARAVKEIEAAANSVKAKKP